MKGKGHLTNFTLHYNLTVVNNMIFGVLCLFFGSYTYQQCVTVKCKYLQDIEKIK